MRPEPEMIPVLIDAAKALKGSKRRAFIGSPLYFSRNSINNIALISR